VRSIVNGFPFFPRLAGPQECVLIQNRFDHVPLDGQKWPYVYTFLPILQIFYLYLWRYVHNDVADRNLIVINVPGPTHFRFGPVQVFLEPGLHLSLIDFGEMIKISSDVMLVESALADLRKYFCVINNELGYYKLVPAAEFRCPLTDMVGESVESVVSMMLRALKVNFLIK